MSESIQRRLSFIGICSGVIVMAMLFSMINTALPAMHRSLQASFTELQWVMNVFGIVNCCVLVTFGRLADIVGRKKVFLLGLLAQLIALLGAGFATSIHQVIFFQFFAGLSNAIVLAVSQALIGKLYPDDQRSKAIGIWAAVIGFGLGIGPVIGGLLTSTLGWRSVYLSPLPLVFIGLFLVLRFTQESKNTEDPPHIDLLGMLAISVIISSFSLALIQSHSWRPSTIVILYVISALALIALLAIEKRVSSPIIRPELFSNRRFLLSSIVSACLVFFIWADFFLLPLFFENIAKLSPDKTGFILLFVTLPVTFLSPWVSRWYHHIPVRWLLMIGFTVLLAVSALQLLFTNHTPLLLFIIAAFLFGIAWSFIWSPSTMAAVSTLSAERAGIAAGTFITIQEIGGTVGLALTSTVAKHHNDFISGFHDGSRVLMLICVIGFLSGWAIQTPDKKPVC